jgi:hypothetical protein
MARAVSTAGLVRYWISFQAAAEWAVLALIPSISPPSAEPGVPPGPAGNGM